MARIVVDPITRIEGHLRIEAVVENGVITDAFSSSTMVRGIEKILRGRDPRDAWAMCERLCGVCTGIHALASVRAVGGSLRHRYWRELVSSVLGRDLELSRRTDASALGATRIAAAAVGAQADWVAAMARGEAGAAQGTDRVSGTRHPWMDDYFAAFKEGYRRLA